jgi:hypothetical protein
VDAGCHPARHPASGRSPDTLVTLARRRVASVPDVRWVARHSIQATPAPVGIDGSAARRGLAYCIDSSSKSIGSPAPYALAGTTRDHRSMAEGYEYKVLELREKMMGGKMSGDKLEKVLNEYAGEGWRLKAITSADVKGRLGPGGVEGLLVTFERIIR